jgi:hypothetical protein
MKWKLVCIQFNNLLAKPTNDRNHISNFVLQRSRLPMRLFDDLVKEIIKAILVGHRSSIGNEAAVHHYILPLPTQAFDCGFLGVQLDERLVRGKVSQMVSVTFSLSVAYN